MWDASEYITAAYTLGIPHPPGTPLLVLLGRVASLVPVGSVALRINALAAVCSAASAALWFLVTERVLTAWSTERWTRTLAAVVAAGAYQPTDYWWSDVQGATTLLAAEVPDGVTLTAHTANLSDWSDINGTLATAVPDAFYAALKNVKEVSLSFGGGGCFAHGVAVSGGSATFQLWSFDISS